MRDIESLVEELYSISAALDFLGGCMNNNEMESTQHDGIGAGYIARLLGERTSFVADCCWKYKTASEERN